MKANLENSKIKNGFTTPTDYFDTFSDKLFEKINGEVTSSLLPKKPGFMVSETYFETNEINILNKIAKQNTKVIRLKYSIYKISGIAAVLLLTIVSPILYHANETKNNKLAEINYLSLQVDDLGTYEVATLLDNEDLNELENELIYNNLSAIN